MRDLNDKVTGSTLTAAEWNEVPTELQNVIEALGITLSVGDLNQLGKAIAGYVANSQFYADSGIADAYVLSVIGSKQRAPSYTDGFTTSFIVANTNTGPSTVNVAGLGVKNIVRMDNTNLAAGDLTAGATVELVYDTGLGKFKLFDGSLFFTGGVNRALLHKLREYVSLEDFGAKGDGTTDDTTEIQAALDFALKNIIGTASYEISSVQVDSSNKRVQIDEVISNAGDADSIVVQDPTPANRLSGVHIEKTLFSGSTGVTDNFADVHLYNVELSYINDITMNGGRTCVRAGYVPAGAHAVDNIISNILAKGAETFGVEHIESDRTILSNLNVGNDGTQIGSHGIRYTGTIKGTYGNVAHGFNVRDRLTTGISIQVGAAYNVHGIGFIENVGESGIQANTASVIDAKSMIPHVIVKDPDSDGLNLSNLSHMFFDSLVDNPGQKGLRIGGGVAPATEGVNMGRMVVVDPGNGGATVASDHNMIDIIVDTSPSSGAILISGNENMIRVISKLSATLTVFVTGNKNHVTMIEDGNGAVGLRVDGDQNVVDGIVTGQTSVGGDNNHINALTIGGVTDTGVGNTKPSRVAL